MNINFTKNFLSSSKNIYKDSLMNSSEFETYTGILEHAREAKTFTLFNLPYSAYKANFSKENTDTSTYLNHSAASLIGHALWQSVAMTIYHVTKGILLSIPQAILGNTSYAKAQFFQAARDLQIGTGLLLAAFGRSYGVYLVEKGFLHQKCYQCFEKHVAPTITPCADNALEAKRSGADAKLNYSLFDFSSNSTQKELLEAAGISKASQTAIFNVIKNYPSLLSVLHLHDFILDNDSSKLSITKLANLTSDEFLSIKLEDLLNDSASSGKLLNFIKTRIEMERFWDSSNAFSPRQNVISTKTTLRDLASLDGNCIVLQKDKISPSLRKMIYAFMTGSQWASFRLSLSDSSDIKEILESLKERNPLLSIQDIKDLLTTLNKKEVQMSFNQLNVTFKLSDNQEINPLDLIPTSLFEFNESTRWEELSAETFKRLFDIPKNKQTAHNRLLEMSLRHITSILNCASKLDSEFIRFIATTNPDLVRLIDYKKISDYNLKLIFENETTRNLYFLRIPSSMKDYISEKLGLKNRFNFNDFFFGNANIRDAFAVFGLEETASKEEVNQAYKKQALKIHPDMVARRITQLPLETPNDFEQRKTKEIAAATINFQNLINAKAKIDGYFENKLF